MKQDHAKLGPVDLTTTIGCNKVVMSSNLSLAMIILSILPIHVGQLSVTDESPYFLNIMGHNKCMTEVYSSTLKMFTVHKHTLLSVFALSLNFN